MSVPCFSGLEELVWDLPSFVWEVNGLLPSHPSTSIKVDALGLFLLIRILLMNHGVQVMLGRVWKDVGLSPNKGVVTGLAMCELVGFNFLIAWMAIGIHTWVKGLFIRFVRNSVWRVQVTCTALIKKNPFHSFTQSFSGISSYGLGDPNAESRCYGSSKDSIVSIIPSLKESQATKWSQLPWDNLACHLGSTHTFCFLLSRVPSLGSLPRRKSVAVFYYFPAGP